jgi:murein DD-endopeptidase MepM/ murein hydrolase activator NlpD
VVASRAAVLLMLHESIGVSEASGRRPQARRGLVAAVAAVLFVLAPTFAGPVAADPVTDAKAKVAAAQRAANEAAARYESAQVRMAELSNEIDRLERGIAAGEIKAAGLRVIAQKRALDVYKGSGDAVPFLSLDSDPLDTLRREKLLDGANARDIAAVDALAQISDELDRQRAAVDARREEQAGALEEFRAETRRLQADLAAAQRAQAAAEEEARRAAEAARKAEEERQARARASESAGSSSAPASGSRPASAAASGRTAAGGLICPIQGPVSFVDSWGAPRPGGRAHQGVDLMSPRGTPNVAVVSGSISQKTGGTSGHGVYLSGDNGDLYYYFHLDAYEGGPRRVSQGDVVGYVGNTGDASGGATHTHFEIHPGGGGAVNPYAAVRAVC